jgi:hypothetical protein
MNKTRWKDKGLNKRLLQAGLEAFNSREDVGTRLIQAQSRERGGFSHWSLKKRTKLKETS